MCRFKFAFQTVCILLRFVYGERLSPHPSGSAPVQIRLSNRLCVSTPRLTASGFSRTLPAVCRFKLAFQTVCVLPTVCVRRAALAAPFRQCAGSNSPFKLFAYCYGLCTASGFRRTLPAVCRFKFAFQTVCVLPTVCVRRAALAAPFRQCAGSNSPFKPLVHSCTSSDGGRLSPHPSGIVPLRIRLSNCLHIATVCVRRAALAAPF